MIAILYFLSAFSYIILYCGVADMFNVGDDCLAHIRKEKVFRSCKIIKVYLRFYCVIIITICISDHCIYLIVYLLN